MPKINNKIQNAQVKILENYKIREGVLKLVFHSPQIASLAYPGQFVAIKISTAETPLLRRPFSIHRVCAKNIEVLYQILGEGTQILSQKKKGQSVDIIGPLGKGFDYSFLKQGKVILVAGGIGVAPLFFLAQKIKQKSPLVVLLGARKKSQILCEKEFKDLTCSVKIATDDGSAGFNGQVTELLRAILSNRNQRPAAIYSCGPHAMLKEIAQMAKEYSVPAQVSLEAHMACGFGACLGCVVETSNGYQRVCKEGPVFNTEEIVW